MPESLLVKDADVDLPSFEILRDYVVREGKRIDLTATLGRLERDLHFFEEKVEGAGAFKRRWNVDYDDFTDTFEDDATKLHQLRGAVAHVRSVFASFGVTPPAPLR